MQTDSQDYSQVHACHKNNNNNNNNNNKNRIRLDLVKHLMIKMSERSFAQRFDDSMSSFSSEKRIKFDNLINTVEGDKT